MSNKFFDFDAFMSEVKEEPVVIRIFGKDEELPASMPADVVLQIVRRNSDPNATMSDAETFAMAERIFGGKLQEWCDKGLTVNQLEVLITRVMQMYVTKAKTDKGGTPKKRGGKQSQPVRHK